MAEISSFIYCLSAERTTGTDISGMPDEKINAIGILAAVVPEFIPSAFSFSIVFIITDVDVESAHSLQIIFKGSQEELLVDTGEIVLPPANGAQQVGLPKEASGLTMSLDFRNVIFMHEGFYKTEVYFDKICLGTHKIYAKGKNPSGN